MYSAVDAGLNQDLIAKYSVDPIDFIEKATPVDGAYVSSTPTVQHVTITNTNTTPSVPAQPTTAPAPKFPDVTTKDPDYTSISYFTKK